MIGEAIAFFRNERKLTQVELGEAVAMSQKTISNIEKNERDLSDEEIIKFSQALLVPVNILRTQKSMVQNISNSTVERGQIHASTYIEGKEELHNELHSTDKQHITFLQNMVKDLTETLKTFGHDKQTKSN